MHVCIVVVGGLQIVVEKRSGSAGRGASSCGTVVDAFATCSGHEMRSGSAVATQVEVHV